jgi:hypothetical protein
MLESLKKACKMQTCVGVKLWNKKAVNLKKTVQVTLQICEFPHTLWVSGLTQDVPPR